MNTTDSAIRSVSDTVFDEYLAVLRAHAGATNETALGHAYDLGRAALASRQSLLDIVMMHHKALDRALADDTRQDERERTMRASCELLAELLAPYDMAQGAFLEANAALRSSNDMLEREAQRIARLLHDSAGQIVFALQLAMADLDRDLPHRLRPRLEELSQLLQQLDQQLRCHAHELYPVMLEDLGLVAALRHLIDNIRQRAGITIIFNSSRTRRLPRDIESAVYRAVQEAFANVIRHSHATKVDVTLGLAGATLVCSIADNGVGFATAPSGHPGPGLGLAGIRERIASINGSVSVKSKPGQGTDVILSVPLPRGA